VKAKNNECIISGTVPSEYTSPTKSAKDGLAVEKNPKPNGITIRDRYLVAPLIKSLRS
jgi:hypothetical protein